MKTPILPNHAHHPMTCRPRQLFAALSILAIVGTAGCNRQTGAPPGGFAAQAAQVGVLSLAPQRIVETTELSGRLSSQKVSDVRPQVSGIILKRLFMEGGDVKAGQVLYQIDPATYQAAYDQARGTLENARATLASAKTKADRFTELVKINAVSKQDYDDAVAAVRENAASVTADEAALESARVNLEYTHVRAPISGRIGASTVTEGALVTSNQTTALATIQAFDQMYLDVTRPSTEWLRLRKAFASGRLKKTGSDSAAVTLVMEDGTEYAHPGALQFSGVTVDATTGSVTLRSTFPNPERELLPGMFVRARLEEGENDNAILVPQMAVTRASDGKASVYVVDAAGNARQVQVTADNAFRDQWIVTSGLHTGDRVIVSGLQSVHAGAPVKVAADTPQTQANAASAAPATDTAPTVSAQR
ncbi:efflux RND transporter periplasmic adaptor subunit [Burkholderia orbicola]|uniref:efflux RND transporter periplasmic adaptor subunit n=1 Tax=Burkholderia cepacia complex TaxID=87882 RepID=UPI000F5763A7|nr:MULTISPECIES: efflux RND transporter periplasmic adaptor subunit [Burkholderia cepacia complex]MDN7471887.1 efflux RND transporter periplasmic adaptor subunit [Burkholderia orbicola]MDN7501650.1 efflux RND transporter periplasmic adaptor subunit [Burkholderia orbicola]RQU18388.1 efflux RND transporter periplasmic adaptor subunit [Burkholderia cenocepacia]RQV42778.1 efflux RND transporter periplasmic adaptor subunit [Burkholderia cenocepacia]RQV45530.1 efflux RND transporter periplasmic adap